MVKKTDCWIDNTNALFVVNYDNVIPHSKMNLSCRINCITRLLCGVAIFLFLFQIFNIELVIIYFLTAILIIIMIYYKEKEKMERFTPTVENFEINYSLPKQPVVDCTTNKARINYNCKNQDENTFVLQKKIIQENIKQNDYSMKNNYNTAEYNSNFASVTDNQSLVGCPNPKTLVAPHIAPPLAALENWKNDSSYGISIINEKKNAYYKESGYDIDGDAYCEKNYKAPRGYYCAQKKNKPATSYNKINEKQPDIQQQRPSPTPEASNPPPEPSKEMFEFPYEIKSKKHVSDNTENLFHKDFKHNPMFHKKYNENVFTQTVTPGTYKINTRNEPINSNMGISIAEQNEEPNYEMIEPFEDVNTSNVYDPRFYGYGTSYRGYVEKNTGQPRFYYDDVDAVRMPNYITRNKIDVMPFGDAYGADNDGGNKYHSNITALADKHYLDSALQFRTEMQDRLMRKINANQWQQKMFPISTNGQRMAK